MFKSLQKLTVLFFLALFTSVGCSSDSDSQPKTHISRIDQAGTTAPTETIIRNTLNLNITWTRLDTGRYKGTLSRAMDLSRTTIFNTNLGITGIYCYFTSNTEIALDSSCGVNVFCDGIDGMNLQISEY